MQMEDKVENLLEVGVLGPGQGHAERPHERLRDCRHHAHHTGAPPSGCALGDVRLQLYAILPGLQADCSCIIMAAPGTAASQCPQMKVLPKSQSSQALRVHLLCCCRPSWWRRRRTSQQAAAGGGGMPGGYGPGGMPAGLTM